MKEYYRAEYMPAIVREYNLIQKKQSKLSRKKREALVALAEALVKKNDLLKYENGTIGMRIKI
jgi:hypothetical protein